MLSLNATKDQSKGLHRNLVLHSAGIWDLLVVTAIFLSNHPDAYSYWRALKPCFGIAEFSMGRR